jgi:hypothetical protein
MQQLAKVAEAPAAKDAAMPQPTPELVKKPAAAGAARR